jgi:hypothetical protein
VRLRLVSHPPQKTEATLALAIGPEDDHSGEHDANEYWANDNDRTNDLAERRVNVCGHQVDRHKASAYTDGRYGQSPLGSAILIVGLSTIHGSPTASSINHRCSVPMINSVAKLPLLRKLQQG